jgi:hypothetical protein
MLDSEFWRAQADELGCTVRDRDHADSLRTPKPIGINILVPPALPG